MTRGAIPVRVLLMLLLPVACVEPFYPPKGSGNGNQMVINGYIDGVAKTATVSLSRGITLDDAAQPPREVNANVTITGSDGSSYTLIERDKDKPGVYTLT